MLLGSHISISGGIDRSILRGSEVGCKAIQIFVKSSHQWRAAKLNDQEIDRYRDNLAKTGLRTVVAHGSYLVNLAGPNRSFHGLNPLADTDRIAFFKLFDAKKDTFPITASISGENCLATSSRAVVEE